MDHASDTTDPRRLAELFQIDATIPAWKPHELAAIFRHQLAAPLAADLPQFDPGIRAMISAWRPATIDQVSFGELLTATDSPVALLERVKHFAKECGSDPRHGLPRDVASALYIAAIFAARRLGGRISEMDDAAVRTAAGWAVAQPWIDDTSRSLFNADC